MPARQARPHIPFQRMSDDRFGDHDELLLSWEKESVQGVVGRVLVMAASLEHELDSAIACYLGADEERWDFVRHDLLGNTTLGRKAELLRRILGHAGVESEFGAMKARLEEFVRIRNACAHWRVTPNMAFDAADPLDHRLSFSSLAKSGGKGKDELRLYPRRLLWLVDVLHDDLYAVQHRLDQMWEPLLINYSPMWTPNSLHDPTDHGPPPRKSD